MGKQNKTKNELSGLPQVMCPLGLMLPRTRCELVKVVWVYVWTHCLGHLETVWQCFLASPHPGSVSASRHKMALLWGQLDKAFWKHPRPSAQERSQRMTPGREERKRIRTEEPTEEEWGAWAGLHSACASSCNCLFLPWDATLSAGGNAYLWLSLCKRVKETSEEIDPSYSKLALQWPEESQVYQTASLLQTSPSLRDRKSGTGRSKSLQSSPSMHGLALTTPYFLPERRDLWFQQVGVSCQCSWGLDGEHGLRRGLCRLIELLSLNLPWPAAPSVWVPGSRGMAAASLYFHHYRFFYLPLVPTPVLTLKWGKFYILGVHLAKMYTAAF